MLFFLFFSISIYLLIWWCSFSFFPQWLNILQSVQLPFALLPVLHFTSSPRLMGAFANRGWINYTCWTLAVLVIGINVYLVETFIANPNSPTPHETWFYLVILAIGLLYFGFIFVVIKDDILLGWNKIKVFFGANGTTSSLSANSASGALAFTGNTHSRRGSGVKAADYSVLE
jgi:hypothetical protein